MADEFDLQRAVVAIAEADAGEGGLVQLHGKPHPVVEWADVGIHGRPTTALMLEPLRKGTGSSGVTIGLIRLDTIVAPGTGRLLTDILNRWEAVLTTPAFIPHGIDVRFGWSGGRPDLTALEAPGSGRRRALQGEYTITN